MKRKWIVSTVMAMSLAMGMLSGCGESSNNEETSTSNADVKFQVVTTRYDWIEDDHALEGFVAETEENAGIDIEWKIYPTSEWGDKKSVILTNEDLPDAFLGALSTTDVVRNKELFVPLEDLIVENMPNLSKILEEDTKLKAIATAPDGHIYGLPQRKPCRPKICYQMFINQVWLDNLNLEMPTTWEEFEEVLRAFKEQDANGNGDPNDEIPYESGNGGNSVYSFILPFQHSGLAGTFGATDTVYYRMTMEDGKPAFLPTLEGYKEGLKWMNQCYEEGLIDQEIFTQDESMRGAKCTNSEVALVGVASGWTPDAVFGEWKEQYVPLPALEGPDGERNVISMPETGPYEAEAFMISKNCSDPARMLRWIDSFYTEDAVVQLYYGSFGIGSQKNEDGTYTTLTPPEGEGADSWAWKTSFREFGPKYAAPELDSRITMEVPTEGDGLKLELAKDLEQYVKPEFPLVRYTDEELSILSSYYTDIESYTETMQAKWITEGGIDEEWDEYIQKLEQMNLGQVVEAVTQAYDRFVESEQ